LYLFIRREIKQILKITGHITCFSCIQNISNILLSILTPSADEIIGAHDSDATGQLLIIYSAFAKYLRKK